MTEKPKQIHGKLDHSPEEKERIKAIRTKYQTERPSMESLVQGGAQFISLGNFLDLHGKSPNFELGKSKTLHRCPKCGQDFYAACISGNRESSLPSLQGQCLNCGFCFATVEGQLNVGEVNELRKEAGLEPLVYLETCPSLSTEMITLLDEVYSLDKDATIETVIKRLNADLSQVIWELEEGKTTLQKELDIVRKFFNNDYPVKDFLEL